MYIRKLFLIGMSRVGKTAIGKMLAKELDMFFFDTDFEIEKKYNLEVPKIFEKLGEKQFREIEFNILKSTDILENSLISTGGGIVENINSCNFLRKQKLIVFINSSPNIIFDRIEKDKLEGKQYPKFLNNVKNSNEAKTEFYKIYNSREKTYENLANIKFKSKNSIYESVKQLKEIILCDNIAQMIL